MPGSAGTSWTMAFNPASQIVSNERSNDAYAWGGHYAVNRSYTANGLNQYTQASSGSTTNYSYDGNGNLAGDGTHGWTYDRENRLVTATGGVELGYDPLGRLAWTTGSPNCTAPRGTVVRTSDAIRLAAQFRATTAPAPPLRHRDRH